MVQGSYYSNKSLRPCSHEVGRASPNTLQEINYEQVIWYKQGGKGWLFPFFLPSFLLLLLFCRNYKKLVPTVVLSSSEQQSYYKLTINYKQQYRNFCEGVFVYWCFQLFSIHSSSGGVKLHIWNYTCAYNKLIFLTMVSVVTIEDV